MIDFDKDLGFVILSPEFRIGGLKTTVSTIKSNFSNPSFLCVTPKTNEEDIKLMRVVSPTVEGSSTISSLINTGIKESKRPWNLIVMAGNIIRYSPLLKYKQFLKSSKEILYRATNAHWRWEDSSLHGLLINKQAMEEIGDFPEEESLPFCKLLWWDKGQKVGYTFKGLVGVRI